MNDEKENDKSKPALIFIVLLALVAILVVSVEDRESVRTADEIAWCMTYNQRISDTWWANLNSALANATARLADATERQKNILAGLPSGIGYESTSQVAGCGPPRAAPQGFKYECTKDPSFVWQSPDGK